MYGNASVPLIVVSSEQPLGVKSNNLTDLIKYNTQLMKEAYFQTASRFRSSREFFTSNDIKVENIQESKPLTKARNSKENTIALKTEEKRELDKKMKELRTEAERREKMVQEIEGKPATGKDRYKSSVFFKGMHKKVSSLLKPLESIGSQNKSKRKESGLVFANKPQKKQTNISYSSFHALANA